jgi:hypothetical protein
VVVVVVRGGFSAQQDPQFANPAGYPKDERGVAKRPDLNELDLPGRAELALDNVEWRKLLPTAVIMQRIAL